MYLDEYEKIEIEQFRGLYKRGMADQCPPDHAICCENVVFHAKGQFRTRDGIASSYVLGHSTKRMFLANTGNVEHLLTMDFSGNLYSDTGGAILTGAFVDFSALNLFNRVYILPTTSGSNDFLYVWNGTDPTARKAAGFAPSTGVTANDGSSGHVDAGVHKFGVCFITDTGFITPPGQKVGSVFTPTIYTAPGGDQVDLSAIPTGGPEIVARYIVVTKANEDLYYFAPGGLINDNTTTTVTLDFYDTDLLVSADYLFDLLEEIPSASIAGALFTFHSRLFLAPGNNTALVSLPSDPESIDAVDGLITLSNPAYNTIRGFCLLRDTLYLVKSTGIVSTFDNGDVPSTWVVTEVDGAHGTFQNAIATISVTAPALAENEMFLLCDLGGIFIFNGAVSTIPLTWKIQDLWETLTASALFNVTIMLDPFKQVFYILLPVNDSAEANLLITADYTDGLTPDDIKWTIYTFPFTPCSIAMLSFADNTDHKYYLRIATQDNSIIFKQGAPFTDDVGAGINSYYQCYLAPVSKGSMNLYRALRFRARGVGNLEISLWPEDLVTASVQTALALTSAPGKDYLRQINFTDEKMSVQIGNGINAGDRIIVDRVDIFGKEHYLARPA